MYYVLLPFSALLKLLYNFMGSYGVALVIFALIVKVILFPFNLKGKKSMIAMNLVNGKMQQLQRQYGKDKARYQAEVQKLYEKEHINPMGGCLWSLIPMIVLFALYYVIREPLTYLMHMSSDLVAIAGQAAGIATEGAYYQIEIAQALNNPDVFANVGAALAAQGYDAANLFQMNYESFGIDLSTAPQWKFWVVGSFTWAYIGKFLIPVVSAVTGLFSSLISMKTNKINQEKMNNNPNGKGSVQTQSDMMQKQMIVMMPVMSLFFAFIMPAGMGVYWIANNLLMIVQELISGKMLKGDYERAAIAKEERERLEKEEEKRLRAEKIAERERKAAEEKELRKKGIQVKKEKDPNAKKRESTTEDGRIGHRAYARGRSYDPNRYPVTPYFDPDAKVTAKVEEAPVAEETAATAAIEAAETVETAETAVEKVEEAVAEATEAVEEVTAEAEENKAE